MLGVPRLQVSRVLGTLLSWASWCPGCWGALGFGGAPVPHPASLSSFPILQRPMPVPT